ncbi:hypothetical protein ACOME3_002108 [Neoechinorhynchus agilis]
MSFPSALSGRQRNYDTAVGSFDPDQLNIACSERTMNAWCKIYPVYINKKRTKSEGRRVPYSIAVDNPTCLEIRDILQHAGLNVYLEQDKMHPREQGRDSSGRGRVIVQLDNNLTSKSAVLRHLCIMFPKLKSRLSTGSGGDSGNVVGVSNVKKRK